MKKFKLTFTAFVLMTMVAFLLKLPALASDAAAFAPVFNATFYAEANADLKAAFGSNETLLFQHFLNSGMAEGRQGSAQFNVHVYQANNPDLKAVLGEDLSAYYMHYINSGKAEGRVAGTVSIPTPDTTDTPSPNTATYVIPLPIYNSSNSSAASPLPPKPASEASRWKNCVEIWTASNGYQVGREPAIYMGTYYAHFKDSVDFRPDNQSPAFWAYVDYAARRYVLRAVPTEKFFLKPSNLPLVELAKTKLTKIESTPSWENFYPAYNNLWIYQMYKDNSVKLDAEIISENGTKIGPKTIASYLIDYRCYFTLEYMEDSEEKCWKLDIAYSPDYYRIPTELMWYGIRNVLRLVEPDAELIYQQIYEHFYGGNHIFPAYDTWVPIGNSQVLVEPPIPSLMNTVSYFFR